MICPGVFRWGQSVLWQQASRAGHCWGAGIVWAQHGKTRDGLSDNLKNPATFSKTFMWQLVLGWELKELPGEPQLGEEELVFWA